jgi:hypothetical protein
MSKQAVLQQKSLFVHYETCGKALNQMMRQGILIPEAFSSVLLLLYLVEDDMEAIKKRGDVTVQDWVQFLHAVDYETFGNEDSPIAKQIADILSSSSSSSSSSSASAKDRLIDEIVLYYVIRPRLAALDAIKRGFRMVNINERLKPISVTHFIDYFFSRTYCRPDQIVSILEFPDTEANLGVEQRQRFRNYVVEAVSKLSLDECNDFLKFATGSASFNSKVSVKVFPHIVITDEATATLCAKSFTCSNSVHIPYPYAAADWYNSDRVLEILIFSMKNGLQSDFSDK